MGGTTRAQPAHEPAAPSDDHGSGMDGKELITKSPTVPDVPELLTTAEVAAVLKVNRSTLSRWRSLGIGPRVTWLSPSIPRYQRADVVAWLRRSAA